MLEVEATIFFPLVPLFTKTIVENDTEDTKDIGLAFEVVVDMVNWLDSN